MTVYVILKKIWKEHLAQYSDGSSELKTWSSTEIGHVFTDKKKAHDFLLADGFATARLEWSDSDYERPARIQNRKFEWDEADILEREVDS